MTPKCAVALICVCSISGCRTNAGTLIAPSIDGRWLSTISNSSTSDSLTFTDGRVTSGLAGCASPVRIIFASPATFNNGGVQFTYQTTQMGPSPDGSHLITVTVLGRFDGVMQSDGSI